MAGLTTVVGWRSIPRPELTISPAFSSEWRDIVGYYQERVTGSNPEVTDWSPILASSYYLAFVTHSSDYWDTCTAYVSYLSTITTAGDDPSYVATTVPSQSGSSGCLIWTTCKDNIMYATGFTITSSECPYTCMTYRVVSDYSDTTSGSTSFDCAERSLDSGLNPATSLLLFQHRPPSTGLTPRTDTGSLSSSLISSLSSSLTSSTASSSPTSTPNPPPPLNTPVGAIVGGVIGGLAFLFVVGVTIWVLKRHYGKKEPHPLHPPPPSSLGSLTLPNTPYSPSMYINQPYFEPKPRELEGDIERPIYEAPGNTETPNNVMNTPIPVEISPCEESGDGLHER
ncbi:hypothetical protein P280DRAFT_473954 [Massarina eburnea CBS 473.64]|uniref:Uncharacterized protein n=1 Tax=Massarina eburnea CBS 473.64 TaxID=1395130 RepID=A0A6A6RJ40_9PLEO|nr:hypothetical protein P280DRAFT_473954 [Massarina eburnea CBS 473.64]